MFVPSTVRAEIAALEAEGLSAPEIARRLGLAPPTVAYHLRRLAAQPPREEEATPCARAAPAHGQVSTRGAVAALLETGMSRAEVARQLGLAKATVSYHARRLNRVIDERCARRYDWAQIQAYYDEGHSVRECIAAFGFSSASWFDAVKRGEIRARPAGMPIEELLREGTYRGRYHLKARLLSEGVKQNRCERCGIGEWQGQPITLALHHVNGVRDDNRLANLELLCPNCHSQTNTFAGRNGRSRAAPGPGRADEAG